MRSASLLLLGLASVTAKEPKFEGLVNSDVKHRLDSLLSFNPENVVQNEDRSLSMGRVHEGETCDAETAAFYMETPLSPANMFLFLSVPTNLEPGFDVEGFFDSLNFDQECQNRGGEVVKGDFGITYVDEKDDTSIEDFRFCVSPVCDLFEFFITQSGIITFMNFFTADSYQLSLESDYAPSYECLLGTTEIYNNTEYEGLLPEAFFEEDGGNEFIESLGEFIESLGSRYCKTFSQKKGQSVKVCNTGRMVKEISPEQFSEFSDYCEERGGSRMDLQLTLDYPNYHRTYLKHPFCKSSYCSTNDIYLYYDWISGIMSGEHGFQFEGGEEEMLPDIHISGETYNTCAEFVSDSAFYKSKNGEAKSKTCKFLSTRSETKRAKTCSKSEGFGGYSPAKDICPSTCCNCAEDKDNEFFISFKFKKTEMVVKHNTCGWLKEQTDKMVRKTCDKKSASYIGGYAPASIACPHTCGKCMAHME